MGWDLRRAALLIEYDTVYGGELLDNPIPGVPSILKLSFPSGLFALRNAWEAAGFTPPAQDLAANPKALPRSKTTLDVSLKDQGTPIDVVPEQSPLTPRIGDMAAANLLREISRSRISYVGILATDIKDEMFLAEQLRRWAPGVILFVFDNNLLYIHPQYNTTMFGTLAISSFPLAPEGALPALSLATPANYRRQFASALQEGTFLAVARLLGKPKTAPAVWIAACGNFAMSPLARLPPDSEPALPLAWESAVEWLGPRRVRAEPARATPPPAGARLQPLLLIIVLVGASYALRKAAFFPWAPSAPPPRRRYESPSRHSHSSSATPRQRHHARAHRAWRRMKAHLRDLLLGPPTSRIQTRLLCVGTALLSVGAAWVLGLAWRPECTVWSWVVFLGQVLGYLYLAWVFLRATGLYDRTRTHRWVPLHGQGAHRWAALGVGMALPPVLGCLAFWLWQPDKDGFFRLRAGAFSGGLSPLVSLAWLLAAVVFWIFIELKRRLVRERHRTTLPFYAGCKRLLAGARPEALRIDRILDRTLAPGMWCLAPLAVMIVPLLGVWPRMQPICESRSYGLIFLALWAVVSVLGLESFVRFLRAWYYLQRMLRYVKQAELLEVLKQIGSEVGWKPTAFSWYTPSYSALKQEVKQQERQSRYQAVDEVTNQPSTSDLCVKLQRAAKSRRGFSTEIALRRELESRFTQAARRLATECGHPGPDEFYAARLIAYLRQIFDQLRYSVVGAFGTGLAAAVAVVTFAFEPRQLLMLGLATIVLGASTATAVVFVQMERDTTLRAIGGTEAGKFNWTLFSKLLTYVALPALTLAAGQFPSIGRLFSGILDPLARLLGSS